MKTKIAKNAFVRPRRRMPGWLMKSVVVMALLTMMLAMLAAIPVLSPGTGAFAADALRAVVGPTPVAMLESVSLRIQDTFNRLRYEMTGGQPQLTWTNDASPEARPAPSSSMPDAGSAQQAGDRGRAGVPLPSAAVAAGQGRGSQGGASAQPAPGSTVGGGAALVPSNPLPDALTVPPLISKGWQAFGPMLNREPVMARTSLRPDPTRPYAQAAVVRIDLSRTQLHLVPGMLEPVAAPDVPPFPRPGMIPADVQASGSLLAAFNGGFKAIHGHFGIMASGVTILPPIDSIATLAIYQPMVLVDR